MHVHTRNIAREGFPSVCDRGNAANSVKKRDFAKAPLRKEYQIQSTWKEHISFLEALQANRLPVHTIG